MNLLEGARGLDSCIFSETFNPEIAAKRAPIVMYFVLELKIIEEPFVF